MINRVIILGRACGVLASVPCVFLLATVTSFLRMCWDVTESTWSKSKLKPPTPKPKKTKKPKATKPGPLPPDPIDEDVAEPDTPEAPPIPDGEQTTTTPTDAEFTRTVGAINEIGQGET